MKELDEAGQYDETLFEIDYYWDNYHYFITGNL